MSGSWLLSHAHFVPARWLSCLPCHVPVFSHRVKQKCVHISAWHCGRRPTGQTGKHVHVAYSIVSTYLATWSVRVLCHVGHKCRGMCTLHVCPPSFINKAFLFASQVLWGCTVAFCKTLFLVFQMSGDPSTTLFPSRLAVLLLDGALPQTPLLESAIICC